jgi:uncharacterized protein (UPF0248 family)
LKKKSKNLISVLSQKVVMEEYLPIPVAKGYLVHRVRRVLRDRRVIPVHRAQMDFRVRRATRVSQV